MNGRSAIFQELGDRASESDALNNIGRALLGLDRYLEAEASHQQALAIAQEIGAQRTAGIALKGIGDSNFRLSRFAVALEVYQQALTILQAVGDRGFEMLTHNGLGFTYERLGQSDNALDHYQQAIALAQALNLRTWEGQFYISLGRVHVGFRQLTEAETYLRQALEISEETGVLDIEAYALSNLEILLRGRQQCDEALALNQRALQIYQDIQDLNGVGIAYGGLGQSYLCLDNPEEALAAYQDALAIQQTTGNRNRESWYLSGIARVFAAQDQPEVAILFLKRSINVIESIRGELQNLAVEIQQSYTDTVARDYRFLADLLLQQGRIPEAQQVLDLLKLEELREFTDTRAVWTSEGVRYTTTEQPVIDAHGSFIALGTQLIECERTECAELETLYDRQESLLAQYDREVARFTATIRDNRGDDAIFQDPERISGDAQDLLEAYAAEGETALLIYPFVLEDKLWLVWATVGNVVGSIEVPVARGDLSATVQRLGELLQTGDTRNVADLQATSQQLYDWLIAPLEGELAANDIDHLVFVNDRVTRYIPMAVLHDGDQYLLERYTLSTVLAPGATEMGDRLGPVPETPVLGLGVTRPIGDFNALPAVGPELAAIVQGPEGDGVYPGQVFLDEAFTLEALERNVADHRVLHIATHAEFVPGRKEESYILLGDGSPLRIPDIERLERRLNNLHLVVLSACQTALGGPDQDGAEIAGLSSYFLEARRAEAVIASLWAVNDTSTSVLMQRFYALLATGDFTKAEALRQAQISLLNGEDLAALADRLATTRAGARPALRVGAELPPDIGHRHPYHWAPFILIGNGL
jgi:CHAT domain-containing protein/tetratricopeptide (TPR) repeat protein